MKARAAPPALDALLLSLLHTWQAAGRALRAETLRRSAERASFPPLRLRPPAGALHDVAAFGWDELLPAAGTQLAGLQVAFDCVLDHRPEGWRLRIVRPRRWRVPGLQAILAPRHRVEIDIDAGGQGELRLDGLVWKRFEAAAGAAP